MIVKTITDSDMIILQSVESYLRSLGAPITNNPQEKLIVTQQARDYLYSDIVQRFARVSAYCLAADMETDTIAQGLYLALSNHVMDPVFINILMQYLNRNNNPEENGIVGAMLTKLMNGYLEQKWKKAEQPTKSTKKGEKEEVKTNDKPEDVSEIQHLSDAIEYLLGDLANTIQSRCGNLTHVEALAIAACIAMNNVTTIHEIISSDLPITAQLFKVVMDPTNLITAALRLEKTEYPKTTQNQQAFLDSLKRWVYEKLNELPTQTCYQMLVAIYGSVKPTDTGKYLIQIKDCGTQYSNLLVVAKQLINN